MKGSTLARLLRLRQIQHDQAKAVLVRANEARGDADAEARRRAEVLHSMHLPEREEAITFLAVTAARQSAALAVRDSRDLLRITTDGVHLATADWSHARAAARGLERLEERHQEQLEVEQRKEEQREQDDRSATRATQSAEPTDVSHLLGGADR